MFIDNIRCPHLEESEEMVVSSDEGEQEDEDDIEPSVEKEDKKKDPSCNSKKLKIKCVIPNPLNDNDKENEKERESNKEKEKEQKDRIKFKEINKEKAHDPETLGSPGSAPQMSEFSFAPKEVEAKKEEEKGLVKIKKKHDFKVLIPTDKRKVSNLSNEAANNRNNV